MFRVEEHPDTVQDAVFAAITRASLWGIRLSHTDFQVHDGQVTLDGMPADQWIDAMTSR